MENIFMRVTKSLPIIFSIVFMELTLRAHVLTGDPANPHYDWSVHPPETTAGQTRLLAQADTRLQPLHAPTTIPSVNQPTQTISFKLFAPRVKVRWDESFLYVENDGIPEHGMMTGITAWQQQVPLPQAYFGENAWRFPLYPVPASQPQSIKNHFLRGAIAIAANGIPIFNPQNNRGEISAQIGELDLWGGHCGRADDYHYHAAPLHLQKVVGKSNPIAFALDGYPIYGLTEPDGSMPLGLDAFNGHTTTTLFYHYHASTNYPYVNGGFHGNVNEVNGQVDPQPRAQPVRRDQPPLRGARIMGFTASPDDKIFALNYTVNDQPASVNYSSVGNGQWKFQFVNFNGTSQEETYGGGGQPSRGGSGDRPARPRPESNGPPPDRSGDHPPGERNLQEVQPDFPIKKSGTFLLKSPEVVDGGNLPKDYTGDGTSSTLPLEWSGAPAGTKSYALIMHHIPGPGDVKWYWIIYNIPANIHNLPKNVKGIGTLGNNSVNRNPGYAPPHSKGPGPKTYILTVYALSAPLEISTPASEVSRAVLLKAMKDKILDSAELRVVYTRTFTNGEAARDRPPGQDANRPPIRE